MEIFQINRHNVMTYHNNPNIGRCGAEMVEKGVGGEAAERRSVYSGTCTVRSAKNKTVCVTRLCGVNAFCQLKSRPAWRVSVRYCGHFSPVSLLILQSESGQEKKKWKDKRTGFMSLAVGRPFAWLNLMARSRVVLLFTLY